MTLQKLASMITKLEGKKSKVKIGDVREILSLLCTLEAAYLFKNKIESTYRITHVDGISPVGTTPMFCVLADAHKKFKKLEEKEYTRIMRANIKAKSKAVKEKLTVDGNE